MPTACAAPAQARKTADATIIVLIGPSPRSGKGILEGSASPDQSKGGSSYDTRDGLIARRGNRRALPVVAKRLRATRQSGGGLGARPSRACPPASPLAGRRRPLERLVPARRGGVPPPNG